MLTDHSLHLTERQNSRSDAMFYKWTKSLNQNKFGIIHSPTKSMALTVLLLIFLVITTFL